MVIRRYDLGASTDRYQFNIPEGGRLLGIYPNDGGWYLWVIGDQYAPLRTRYFRAFAPGEKAEITAGPCRPQDYIGGFWWNGNARLLFEVYP